MALYNRLHSYDGRSGSERWADALASMNRIAPTHVYPTATHVPAADPALEQFFDGEQIDDIPLARLRESMQFQLAKVDGRTRHAMQVIRADLDASGFGFSSGTAPHVSATATKPEMQAWATLREKLVSHYTHARAKREVFWLF